MVMRNAILSFAGWAAAVQVVDGVPRLSQIGHVLSIAGQLTVLTIAVYRLGRWHQAMEHTRADVLAAVKRIEAAVNERLDRTERRIDGLDHMATIAVEARAKEARRHSKVDRRLLRLEQVVLS